MCWRYRPIEVERVGVAVVMLKQALEYLTQIEADLRQHGMTGALFPWSQRQWENLDSVVTLAKECAAVLPPQIAAKIENRPTAYDVLTEKRRRGVAARKARTAATSPKPRGRPKKSSN